MPTHRHLKKELLEISLDKCILFKTKEAIMNIRIFILSLSLVTFNLYAADKAPIKFNMNVNKDQPIKDIINQLLNINSLNDTNFSIVDSIGNEYHVESPIEIKEMLVNVLFKKN